MRQFVLVSLIFCLHILPWGSGQTALCPDGFLRHATSCYRFLHVYTSWPEAVAFCQTFGAHLVRVETEAEHDFLKMRAHEMIGSYPLHSFWIAASDAIVQGEWIWAGTLKRLTYAKWTPGQPSNVTGEDCAGLYYEGGYNFGDWYCRSLLHPICEIDIVTEGDGSEIIGLAN